MPAPRALPGLGVVVASGVPRYIMPTIVLTLETPERVWRNRGLCSLPRARAWIDLFSQYAPPVNRLRLHGYGQSAPELRFLEDQDGSEIWTNAFDNIPGRKSSSSYSPDADIGLEVGKAYESLKALLDSHSREADQISVGYHFVDIPLKSSSNSIILPRNRMKMYLTDIEEPKRLINYENVDDLDLEPLGELDVEISTIGAGGTSEFLPKVYTSLFEPGNIIFEG